MWAHGGNQESPLSSLVLCTVRWQCASTLKILALQPLGRRVLNPNNPGSTAVPGRPSHVSEKDNDGNRGRRLDKQWDASGGSGQDAHQVTGTMGPSGGAAGHSFPVRQQRRKLGGHSKRRGHRKRKREPIPQHKSNVPWSRAWSERLAWRGVRAGGP